MHHSIVNYTMKRFFKFIVWAFLGYFVKFP